jgi:Rieske Fe-S protein
LTKPVNRRSFLTASATALAGFSVVACRRDGVDDVITDIAKSKIHEKLTRLSLDEYPTLSKDGNAVEIAEDAKQPPLLLIRHNGEIRAFMNLCTHSACPLLYDRSQGRIACNPECGHGSIFGLDGSVVRGPATYPLFRFPAELGDDGRTLTVRFRLERR